MAITSAPEGQWIKDFNPMNIIVQNIEFLAYVESLFTIVRKNQS